MGKSAREGLHVKHMCKTRDALAIFEGCLQKNPKDALALYGKAWSLALLKDPGAADAFKAFLAVGKDATQVKEAKAALSRLASGGGAAAAPAGGGMSAPAGGGMGGPGGGMGGPGGAPGGGPGGPPAGGPGGPPMGGPGGPPAGGPGGPPG